MKELNFKPWTEMGIGGETAFAFAYHPYPHSITGELAVHVRPIQITSFAIADGTTYVRNDDEGVAYPTIFKNIPTDHCQPQLRICATMNECLSEYRKAVTAHFNKLTEDLRHQTELRLRGINDVGNILTEIAHNEN